MQLTNLYKRIFTKPSNNEKTFIYNTVSVSVIKIFMTQITYTYFLYKTLVENPTVKN